MDIKDRIQKLLALSVNPNENEAKAALLKAQELMAKHKLSMADFEAASESEVGQYNTGIQCSNAASAKMNGSLPWPMCWPPITAAALIALGREASRSIRLCWLAFLRMQRSAQAS